MKFLKQKLNRCKSTATLIVDDCKLVVNPNNYDLQEDIINFPECRIFNADDCTIGVHEVTLEVDSIKKVVNGGILYD